MNRFAALENESRLLAKLNRLTAENEELKKAIAGHKFYGTDPCYKCACGSVILRPRLESKTNVPKV